MDTSNSAEAVALTTMRTATEPSYPRAGSTEAMQELAEASKEAAEGPARAAAAARGERLPLHAEDAFAKLRTKRQRELSSGDESLKRAKSDADGAEDAASNGAAHESHHHHHNHPGHHHHNSHRSSSADGADAVLPIAESTVDNSDVLAEAAQFERRIVGSTVYEPGKLLAAGHELHFNCVLTVHVGHAFLKPATDVLEARALWGTEVYTDDSDLVAVLHHLGHLPIKEDSDLTVQILLLPVLKRYAGSYRHGLSSRSWHTRHDGISYMVLDTPKRTPIGSAHSRKDLQLLRFKELHELRSWKPEEIAFADS